MGNFTISEKSDSSPKDETSEFYPSLLERLVETQ